MAESFGVEDRGHFYDPVGALRDVVVNHLMQVVAACAMEPPSRGDPTTLKDAQVALFRAIADGRPGALRPRPVRRLPRRSTASRRTRRPRPTRRCGSRSRTGAGRACRSSSAPASGCRSTQTELRLVFKHAAAARLRARCDRAARAEPARRQARPVDRDPARRSTRTAPTSPSRSRSSSTWSSPRRAARAPTPYEVLLHAAIVGDSTRFTRQDGVEEALADHAAAARRPAAGAPVRAGHRGARPRPTTSSPATAAGTSPGWTG